MNLYRTDGSKGTQTMNRDGHPHFFVGRRVIGDVGWRRIRKHLRMSEREFEIAQALFDDMNESEIADTLGISPHTVHTHLERLYRKTGVSSRVQLVVFVLHEYMDLSDPS